MKLTLILLLISICSFGQKQLMTDHELSHIISDIEKDVELITRELNYVREHPREYGESIGIDLSEYSPMGAVEENDTLSGYAQWYAEELLSKYTDLKHSDMPFAEIILWNYDPCVAIEDFIVDRGVPDLGHRKAVLNKEFTQYGIGIVRGYVGIWHRFYIVILFD